MQVTVPLILIQIMADKIASDPQMQRFIQVETQRQKFNQVLHSMTEQCWDVCMGTPSQSLDRKTQTCMVNCVERFLDTTNFVVNRLQKEGEKLISNQGSESSENFKWQ